MLFIKKPIFEQLEYVAYLWNDKETMTDVGGTHLFPENERYNWYERNVKPTDGKNQYFLVFTENTPVGEVRFHRYDAETKTAELNIKIEAKYRGNGYAKQAVRLLLDYYFNIFGGECLIDRVTSESGKKLLPKCGFTIREIDGDITIFEIRRM